MCIIAINKTYLLSLFVVGNQVYVYIQDVKIVFIKFCSYQNMIISFACLHINLVQYRIYFTYSKLYMN